ncbi:thiosulfate sulfurtransferase GlpE [Zhongshania borealis]|jgi:thiosulfate sulfurtransferase|tara:strand:+ start:1895 stop:2218 length:324 start_codon:yes stop_codon:yes gene_type:complete
MPTFKHISPQDAQAMIAAGNCQLADIRDEQSFASAHIPAATHLDNQSLQQFVEAADPDQALIIYCYHGNSSQSAAQYFVEKDFTEVYSMDGGFEMWRQLYPAITVTS